MGNDKEIGSSRLNELDRLRNLDSLRLDIDAMRERLTPYVELAKQITNMPVCEINIIDAYQQWTIAGAEEGVKVISREESVCNDTIQLDENFHEIEDLKKNERYKDRFYVAGEPFFRYYGGVQLKTKENYPVGSLCVIDNKKRKLSDAKKRQLNLISEAVSELLNTEHRRKETLRVFEELRNDIRKLNHDVRTPINGIVGMAEMMEGADDQSKTVELIKKCAYTVVEKIDNILADKTGSGEQKLSGESDISEILNRLNYLYRPVAIKKNVNLDFIAKSVNCFVQGSLATRLIQILGNLISNGLKFTDEGGSVKIKVQMLSGDGEENGKILSDKLVFTVSDTGKGMTSKQVKAFNGDDSGQISQSFGTAGEQSFGIGLNHVKQLVKEGDGEIKLDSKVGEGACFHLILPLIRVGNN